LLNQTIIIVIQSHVRLPERLLNGSPPLGTTSGTL